MLELVITAQRLVSVPETQVDSAWCQLLKLEYDKLPSIFAFNFSLRHYMEAMKPYVDDEIQMLRRWMGGVGGAGEGGSTAAEGGVVGEAGSGEGGEGGEHPGVPFALVPEGESVLGQWVGREAEKPATAEVEASDAGGGAGGSGGEASGGGGGGEGGGGGGWLGREASSLTSSSSPSSTSSSQGWGQEPQQQPSTQVASNPAPSVFPKPAASKPPSKSTSSSSSRKCAAAFEDQAGCRKVVKLPECAGSPYRGGFWTLSKAAIKAGRVLRTSTRPMSKLIFPIRPSV